MKMNTLILSGGNTNLTWLKNYLNANSFNTIICVDKGLEIAEKLNILPNYIVGDFDSVDKDILKKYVSNPNITIQSLNPEKDNTDTEIALNLAIELHSTSITIIGALGNRMDHSISNIHILLSCLKKKIPCCILDPYNKISLIDSYTQFNKNAQYGKYVSFLPFTATVTGITLQGFKYPLNGITMDIGTSLCVSNEIVQNIASIDLKTGILIMIQSKD